MSDIDKVLTERGKQHGDYATFAYITQHIKDQMRTGNWGLLSPSQKECLEMVASKIGRILAGNPNHQDHWTDIAGYARLVERQLEPTVAAAEELKYGVNI